MKRTLAELTEIFNRPKTPPTPLELRSRGREEGLAEAGRGIAAAFGIEISNNADNILDGEVEALIGILASKGTSGFKILKHITVIHNNKGSITVTTLDLPRSEVNETWNQLNEALSCLDSYPELSDLIV